MRPVSAELRGRRIIWDWTGTAVPGESRGRADPAGGIPTAMITQAITPISGASDRYTRCFSDAPPDARAFALRGALEIMNSRAAGRPGHKMPPPAVGQTVKVLSLGRGSVCVGRILIEYEADVGQWLEETNAFRRGCESWSVYSCEEIRRRYPLGKPTTLYTIVDRADLRGGDEDPPLTEHRSDHERYHRPLAVLNRKGNQPPSTHQLRLVL